MSSTTTLTINMPTTRTSQAWRRNQNTVRHQLTAGLGPVSHTVLIAIMLSILGLIYLTQITKTSAYGYQINDLKNKQAKLADEKRDLQVQSARLQALARVQNSDVAKAMTTPTETAYAQN